MKFNFRKISAVATSILLAGMSFGVAAAANYPAPFVSGSNANVAIVVGANADSMDTVAATSIQTDLQSSLSGTSGAASAVGGDSYQFERTTTKLHLGDNISVIKTTLDDDELPTLLASGTYSDVNNDEFDYDQKVTLPDLQVSFFEDATDNDAQKIGVLIEDGDPVLNYTLDFSSSPDWADLETTDLTLMGKTYYVLKADNDSQKLTLLDSATEETLNEGESKTILGHDVTLDIVTSDEAQFTVDGEKITSMSEGSTKRLNDGSYLGVKDIIAQNYQGGLKQVTFSIGSGKLVLEDGKEVELNEDNVNGVKAYLTSGTTLDSITIEWTADDDLYVTKDNEITMPGFEALKLSFGGMNFPAEETIKIAPDGDQVIGLDNFPTVDSTNDISLLEFNESNGNITYVGEEKATLRTSSGSSLTFNASHNADGMFIATYENGDEGESYLLKFDKPDDNGEDDNTSNLYYMEDGSWTKKKTVKAGDDVSLGSVDLTIDEVYPENNTIEVSAGTNVNFDTLISKEGMQVALPPNALADGGNKSYDLVLTEEDEDDTIAGGESITITLGTNSDNNSEVTSVSGADSDSFKDSDVYTSYVYSALATKIAYDKGPDQDEVELTYHGSESSAQLFITAPNAVITTGEAKGVVIVKDNEVDSVSDKNLIVVGGSCINTVAASILGVADGTCGSDFTTATGVGTGQYLIKSAASPVNADKIAVLVAGYEAADTQAAATYLTTQTVDTSSIDKKFSTATNLEVV